MPRLTKETPNGAQPKLSADDILSEAINVSDMQDDYIKFLLYGINRVGKTTLACQFPKPLLLVSFEPASSGGARSIKNVPGVHFFHIVAKGWKDQHGNVQDEWGKDKAFRLAQRLRQNCPYKTVVMDTVTSLEYLILQQIMDLPEVPEQLNWGLVAKEQYQQRSEQCKDIMRAFLNLPCHVVACAQEKDHNATKDIGNNKLLRGVEVQSFFAAALGGANTSWLQDHCDYIARLYLAKETSKVKRKQPSFNGAAPTEVESEEETGRNIRCLRTMLHQNFAAGFRSANPEAVPEFIKEPTFEKIEKVIKGIKLVQ